MDEKTNGMEKDTSLDGLDNMSGGAGDDEWEINIDKLLAQADMLVNNDMLPPMPEFEGESNKRPAEKAGERETGTEPVKQTENASDSGNGEASSKSPEMDSDLDEINNLLQQADLNEKIDDDMLALLESATENQEDEDNPDEVPPLWRTRFSFASSPARHVSMVSVKILLLLWTRVTKGTPAS